MQLLVRIVTFLTGITAFGFLVLQGKVDPGAIRVQELAAKMGSALAFSAASIPLGLSIKDTITGAGQDPYDETY